MFTAECVNWTGLYYIVILICENGKLTFWQNYEILQDKVVYITVNDR